jgi:hypothetical protein
MNWFQRFYWTKLSKPAGERPLCEYLIKTPIGSVLQLGMGNGALTRKVLQMARPAGADGVIRFAGVDAFESAEAVQQHMKLKDAHRMCAELGVKAHLIPGELKSALPRVAVTILPSDLLIVEQSGDESATQNDTLMQWLPRLSHSGSAVFVRQGIRSKFERIYVPIPNQARQAA